MGRYGSVVFAYECVLFSSVQISTEIEHGGGEGWVCGSKGGL